MKKTIQLLSGALLTALLMLSASCKKDAGETVKPIAANQVIIKLNGIQQSIDSLVVKPRTINAKIVSIDIFYYVNHGTGGSGAISLLFAPSNPAYATGTKLNLLNGDAELDYLSDSGNTFDDNPQVFPAANPNPAGTIMISKNDVTARRIEGTLTGCVLPLVQGSGSGSVTIGGSFAISY